MGRDKKKSRDQGPVPTKEAYRDELLKRYREAADETKGEPARDDANGDVDRTFRDVVEIRTGGAPPYTRDDIEIGLLTNALGVMSDGPLRDRLERKLADLLDPQQEQGDDTTPEDSWGKDVPS